MAYPKGHKNPAQVQAIQELGYHGSVELHFRNIGGRDHYYLTVGGKVLLLESLAIIPDDHTGGTVSLELRIPADRVRVIQDRPGEEPVKLRDERAEPVEYNARFYCKHGTELGGFCAACFSEPECVAVETSDVICPHGVTVEAGTFCPECQVSQPDGYRD